MYISSIVTKQKHTKTLLFSYKRAHSDLQAPTLQEILSEKARSSKTWIFTAEGNGPALILPAKAEKTPAATCSFRDHETRHMQQ